MEWRVNAEWRAREDRRGLVWWSVAKWGRSWGVVGEARTKPSKAYIMENG